MVEDDDDDAAIFCRYARRLTNVRVEIVRAADAEDALISLAGEHFDLIFVDLDLGGPGSGIDLLQALHRGKPDTPAIVVTGSGDEEKAVDAMKAAAYDYITKKSLCPDLLERTIRNTRKRHELERERACMVHKLEEMSVTDKLTGLANRRRFDEKLEEEVQRSTRTAHVFALLMIDLDKFKEVNDRHGHQTGDEVLKQCADTLQREVRRTDFVARYGGEEFCALLPDTAGTGGLRLANRLREAVKALPEPVPTISVGVASWQSEVSAEELVRRADEALYRAKEAGRDRAELFARGQGENQ